MRIDKVLSKITQWHKDRNLIEGSSDLAQFNKLIEEVQELWLSLKNSASPIDDIGDIIVVLVNIAERNGLTIEECLEHAYEDIKDRKGRMVRGVFVKDD